MNDFRLEDFKQLLESTVAVSEARLRMEVREMKLELKSDLRREIRREVRSSHDSLLSEMSAGFAGVADSFEALSELIDDDRLQFA